MRWMRRKTNGAGSEAASVKTLILFWMRDRIDPLIFAFIHLPI